MNEAIASVALDGETQVVAPEAIVQAYINKFGGDWLKAARVWWILYGRQR